MAIKSKKQMLKESMEKKACARIATPAELRSLLLEAAVSVIEGRLDPARANAVIGLSSEVHKSIKSEYEMRMGYTDENTRIIEGEVVKNLLGD